MGLWNLQYLENEFINWADFLHADSDAIFFKSYSASLNAYTANARDCYLR